MFKVAVLLMLCAPAFAQPRNESLHRLFEAFYEAYLRENPETATSVGRTDHDTRWRDWSRPAREAWAERLAGFLVDLDGFALSDLNIQDRLSAKLLRGQIETELEGLPYEAYLLRVNQLFGLHTDVLLTVRAMPARTAEDYENILARLRAIPRYVDENIATLRQAIDAGVVQPRLIVGLVVKQLEAQSAPEAQGRAGAPSVSRDSSCIVRDQAPRLGVSCAARLQRRVPACLGQAESVLRRRVLAARTDCSVRHILAWRRGDVPLLRSIPHDATAERA